MGKALYRKYRSRSLDEIIGQDHIVNTLKNALETGKIAHAYLFTGPRGSGKTSIARILAYAINDLPYSEETHFDIIEIDAASNNSVEDIRDLREKVHIAPTSARYKVYIIDEVHMLSKSAFNALLKTLEEPPAHVVFMFATTEAHKLPATIVSRTQRFVFRPVPTEIVASHLSNIAKQEKIDVDDDALKIIAEHGEGSFRDSISLLDQAGALGEKITAKQIEDLLGKAPSSLIDSLFQAVNTGQLDQISTVLREFFAAGYEPAMVAKQLGGLIRAELSQSASDMKRRSSVSLLRSLLDVPTSRRPTELLELILIEHVLSNSPDEPAPSVVSPSQPTVQLQPTPKIDPPIKTKTADKPSGLEIESKSVKSTKPVESAEPTTQTEPSANPPETTEELWQAILAELKKSHNTLYGIARMAAPELNSNDLTLKTKFPFHQKKLSEKQNLGIIAKCASQLRGTSTNVAIEVSKDVSPPVKKSQPTVDNDISSISNIFGGAELI